MWEVGWGGIGGGGGGWGGTRLTGEGQRSADGVQTLDEGSIPEGLQHRLSDPCHDAHADHHVGRVGQLDADLGQR